MNCFADGPLAGETSHPSTQGFAVSNEEDTPRGFPCFCV